MSRHQFPRFSEQYSAHWRSEGLWSDITLHGGFDATVARSPDSVAIITDDSRYSFREFKQEADALAAGLIGIGISKGDIVSVQLPNWLEFCLLQLALSRIGAVIQPLHMIFRERDLKNLYAFCETDVAIVAGEYKGVDYAAMTRELMPDLPVLEKMVVVRGDARDGSEHGLAAIIEEGRDKLDRLDGLQTSADDIFYLNFTSGTEGTPKGFLHSHNTLVSLIASVGKHQIGQDPKRINLGCSPMTHSFGHFITYYCVLAGIPMVLVDRYNPTLILEIIEQERVTALSGTPAHFIGLLNHENFDRYDTSSITSAGVGGARSAPELISKLEKVWGVKTGNTYGMGETIIHTMTLPDDPDEKIQDSVGRPIPGAQLKIVSQADRSVEQEPNEIGEICFRGPTLFVGYHNQPDLTAKTRDESGWFYTGDLGFVDDEGYLCFAGRAKEVINRGGSKIYPKEIEDVISAYPAVRDVAVVGMPDERMGEIVCAFVLPKDKSGSVSLNEIKAFLESEKVMKYMIPEELICLDEFPMTPTGKVRKNSLWEQARDYKKASKAQ